MNRTTVIITPLFLVSCLVGCSESGPSDSSRGGDATGGVEANGGSVANGGINASGGVDASGGDQSSAGDQSTSGRGEPEGGSGGDGAAGAAGAAGSASARPHALFNGVDFTNWDRYLGKPSAAEEPLGLNNDPRGVYSVVQKDGEPALRISGEVWGSLISQAEFCNFDLQAEYQWGTAVWPPLNFKDSGIMFLSTGPFGAVNAGGNALSDPMGSGGFLVSAEYQIAQGDIGSLYNLGPISFATSSHTPQAELAGWNSVEIVHKNGVATSLLNGQQVSQIVGFHVTWPGSPEADLRCGKLQLQCEGAEIYFRHVVIRELP